MQNCLGQFYTKEEIAKLCWEYLADTLSCINRNIDEDNLLFLEPSAGTGSFFKLMPSQRRIGIDLEPKYEGVVLDYLIGIR